MEAEDTGDLSNRELYRKALLSDAYEGYMEERALSRHSAVAAYAIILC